MDPLIVLSNEIERANYQAADYQQQICFFRAHHPGYAEDIIYQQLLAEKMEVMRGVTKMRKELAKRVVEISREGMAIYTMETGKGLRYFADVANIPLPPAPAEPAEPQPGEQESKFGSPATEPTPTQAPSAAHTSSRSRTAMMLADELVMSPVARGLVDPTPSSPPQQPATPHTLPLTSPHVSAPTSPSTTLHFALQHTAFVHTPPLVTPLSPAVSPVLSTQQLFAHSPPQATSPQFMQAPHTQQLHVQQASFQPMYQPPQQYQAPHMHSSPHPQPTHTQYTQIQPPHHQPSHTNPPHTQLPQMKPQQPQVDQYTAAKAQLASIMRDHSELRGCFVGLDGRHITAQSFEHQEIRRWIKAGQDPALHMRGQYRSYPVSYVKSSNSFVHNRLFFPEFHAY